jgi:hypothetical protein
MPHGGVMGPLLSTAQRLKNISRIPRWGLSLLASMTQRRHGWRIANYARFVQYEATSPIPEVRWPDLLRPGCAIEGKTVEILPGGYDYSNWVDTGALLTLIKLLEPRVLLEIGTKEGRNTWHFLHNAPEGAIVYTIDAPDWLTPEEARAGVVAKRLCPVCDQVQHLPGDTRTWDGRLDRRLQFAFIDGNHSYEDVRRDSEHVIQNLDDDACVCWHSSLWQEDGFGVYRYLRELMARGHRVRRISGSYEVCTISFWMTPRCEERFNQLTGR